MANINKIRISGTSYDIQDSNATKVVDITQAEYNALPASAKTANVLYNITDAEAVDFSQYWTSAETQSAITEATSGKVSTSDFNTYSGSVDTALNSKASQTDLNTLSGTVTSHTASTTIHVTAQDKTNWNNKSDFSGSYNDLTDKPTIPTVPTNVSDFTNDAGYITSSALDGYATTATTSAINNTLTGHTADTTIHVSAEQIAAWNAKSDFSGSYNDLIDKPTIPTSASQLTNDTGYITSSALNGYATTGDVQTATNDMATKTWVGQQGYLTQHQDISGKQDVSGMTAYTETTAFTAHTADTTVHVTSAEKASWNAKSDFSGSYNDLTNKLSAGTNITIVDNVISAEGGGKAVTAGTNISITTGETADTINCTLPLTVGSSNKSLSLGVGNNLNSSNRTLAIGDGNTIGNLSANSLVGGMRSSINYNCSNSIAFGYEANVGSKYSYSIGTNTKTSNQFESAFGLYNASNTGSTNADKTLFSVGNGTSNNARHNAFEIRQNGDIYLNDGSKLQDTVSATTANTTALGGLKLVKLSQSEYDSLATKDNSTLYVIVN